MNLLELKNVAKRYRRGNQDVHALRDVNLSVAEGDFIAIMGPSGSGKSTLMHVLGLLDVPTAGSYCVDGAEIAHLSEDDLAERRRESFGFVFQQFNLLPRISAEDNVALPLMYSYRKTDTDLSATLLDRVGLAHRLSHRPQELSGGQQQRVAIARSLVNRPRIILADEPTGDLDSASEQEILALFDELNECGITIIVVTHEEEVGRRARRIIRMRDGKIQSDERRAEIPAKTGRTFLAPPEPRPISASKPVAWLVEAREYLKQGIVTLSTNKVRTALSTLGILMGVAAVVTMLALGRGAQKDVESQIASMGSNLLVLKNGAIRVGAVQQETGAVTRVTLDDATALKERVPLVREASPTVEGKIQATFYDRNWQTKIIGVKPEYERIRAARPQVGRFFTEDENLKRERVALIGPTVARKLFGGQSAIGERIRLNRVSFQVIGLLPNKGTAGWRDQDDVILIPIFTAMRRVLGKDYVDSVDIEVADMNRMSETEARILEVMLSRHRVGSSRFDHAFELRNMAQVKEALSQSSRTLSMLLASIAVISLLVGGIGIMNIMLVSVTERTREIGVRKAIGARRSDILAQFLSESVVVTLLGGMSGIILGCVSAVVVSHFTGWSTSISLASVVVPCVFSITIGLIFGIYPARKASLLHPIEALRHE